MCGCAGRVMARGRARCAGMSSTWRRRGSVRLTGMVLPHIRSVEASVIASSPQPKAGPGLDRSSLSVRHTRWSGTHKLSYALSSDSMSDSPAVSVSALPACWRDTDISFDAGMDTATASVTYISLSMTSSAGELLGLLSAAHVQEDTSPTTAVDKGVSSRASSSCVLAS